MHSAEKHARSSEQARADHSQDGGSPAQRSLADAYPDSKRHGSSTNVTLDHARNVSSRHASSNSHVRPNLKSAIMAHIGPSLSTVPAKRKESLSSPIERQSHVEPVAHPPLDEDNRAAKRIRYTPPKDTREALKSSSLDIGSKSMPADTEKRATIRHKSPTEPPVEQRPPPPPPLTPFTVPRTSPTALQTPVLPAVKRKKRALTFGPDGETSRDAPIVDDQSMQSATQHNSRRLSQPPLPTKQDPGDTNPRTSKKEDSLPPATVPSTLLDKDKFVRQPSVDRPPHVGTKTTMERDRTPPLRQPHTNKTIDRPASSAHEKAQKSVSMRNAARSRDSVLSNRASPSVASEAGPSSLSSSSASRSAALVPSSSRTVVKNERVSQDGASGAGGSQKHPHDRLEARSTQQTSKGKIKHEVQPDNAQRSAKNATGGNRRRDDEDGDDDRHPKVAKKIKPQTHSKESEPPKKKMKLLPLESIIQQAQERDQQEQHAHERHQPEQIKPAAPVQTPSAVPEQVPVTPMQVKDELEDHALSIAGPSLVDESPRLVFAKKQASAELSFMHHASSNGKHDVQPVGPRDNAARSLEALFMLADAAETKQASAVQPKAESHSSEARESSMDSARSLRDRAQQQAQKELMHTEDLPSLQNRPGPKPGRKLSEILDDEDTSFSEDVVQSDVTVRADEDLTHADKDAGLAAAQGLLGLAHYESSPEPEPLTDAPAGVTQWTSTDSPGLSMSSATSDGQIRPDLPTGSALALATAGSHSSSLPVAHDRKNRGRRVVLSPEPEMAPESSVSHADNAQHNAPPRTDHVSPTVSLRRKADSVEDETPAPPQKRAKLTPPAVDNASQEDKPAAEAPVPAAAAPAKKKFGKFKKTRQAPEATEPAKEKPIVLPPPAQPAASLPPPPVPRPPPTQQPTTPYGRQLPPEHSSRDVDPTSVLSSVLGKPKRDANGITLEQRKEWDAKKAADRAAREAQYAASGPPLRMQRQMQTILKYEQKFKAKRVNISPSVVAAAFRQQWEKANKTTWQWPQRPNMDRPSGNAPRPLPSTPHNGYNPESQSTPRTTPRPHPSASDKHPPPNPYLKPHRPPQAPTPQPPLSY